MADSSEMSEQYQWVCEQIQREEKIVRHRLSWVFGFQGIALTSLSILHKKDTELFSHPFCYLISGTGILVCLLGLLGIIAAAITKDDIKLYWETKSGTQGINFPPFCGSGIAKFMGRALSYGIPLVFMLFWVIMLILMLLAEPK